MKKKKTSTFSKITKFFVWLMILVTIGGVLASAMSLLNVF